MARLSCHPLECLSIIPRYVGYFSARTSCAEKRTITWNQHWPLSLSSFSLYQHEVFFGVRHIDIEGIKMVL